MSQAGNEGAPMALTLLSVEAANLTFPLIP